MLPAGGEAKVIVGATATAPQLDVLILMTFWPNVTVAPAQADPLTLTVCACDIAGAMDMAAIVVTAARANARVNLIIGVFLWLFALEAFTAKRSVFQNCDFRTMN